MLIPGVGPFLAGGTIATTLAGAGIGAAAGGIVGALTGLGIPEEDAKAYSDRVSHGDYLVFIEGTAADIDRASTVLSNRGVQGWKVYDMPASDSYANTMSTHTKVEPRAQRYASDTTERNVVSTTNQPEVQVVDRRKETR
ncbi:DUF1269 domain-containing protein [Gloeocapsopsis dulcis]|uniref:DUF1269 domain-containing protein n=1 Tax=Gloeocapsopsis dulcis TaxID=2859516 RepID=UPI0018C7DE4C|nr:DUF1269 domain-containing protein [Gloeocapsopsis dulcis]WNN87925.1 DUF1269 domain-containing protein [Gloeocapsopsis dulcis]